MNILITRLSDFLEETLDPVNLAGKILSDDDFKASFEFISNSIATLRRNTCRGLHGRELTPEDQVRLQGKLTSVSNTTLGFVFHPLLKTHPSSTAIRKLYRFACAGIESLLTILNTQGCNNSVPISNFAVRDAVMQLKGLLNKLISMLELSDLDPVLKETLLFTLGHQVRKKGITWREYYSMRDFISGLLDEENYDTPGLMNQLIRLNFNTPEFFLYCTRYWRHALAENEGLEQQIELMIKEHHRIYEISLEERPLYCQEGRKITTEVREYLWELHLYLKNLLKIRKSQQRIEGRSGPVSKFPVNLSVPQFGLFIRLQIERGILPKERVGQLFNFFATHFYTPGTKHISADSLQKKSTDVEFSTARQLKAHLITMLNWLNTNYNLSNYS